MTHKWKLENAILAIQCAKAGGFVEVDYIDGPVTKVIRQDCKLVVHRIFKAWTVEEWDKSKIILSETWTDEDDGEQNAINRIYKWFSEWDEEDSEQKNTSDFCIKMR
jgi:hypothetical protein